MSKQFVGFLALGLAVVAAFIAFTFVATKGNHLELTGTILKIRVLHLNANASLVVADFRLNDPSDIPFVVKTVTIQLEPQTGETVDGRTISKADMDNVFKYEPLIGPKFNDVISIKDMVPAHQHLDRMAGARFELPESDIEARKTIHVRIEEFDGTVSEVTEKNLLKK